MSEERSTPPIPEGENTTHNASTRVIDNRTSSAAAAVDTEESRILSARRQAYFCVQLSMVGHNYLFCLCSCIALSSQSFSLD